MGSAHNMTATRQMEPEHLNYETNKCNLRKSLAWDCAFFTSPGVLEPEELLQTVNLRDLDNDFLGREDEQILSSSRSTESERRSYYRKSLAWDSAFFTSAGVLDPEELSIINKGLEKCEMRLLPGILEEVCRSTESNLTIGSDASTLTSLEMDLFEDMRASTQKSSSGSHTPTSSFKLGAEALKKQNAPSRTRMNLMPSTRKQNVNSNGSGRIMVNASILPRTKRPSLTGNHVRAGSKTAKSASGQCLSSSRKTCLRETYNVIHISTPPKSDTVVKSPSNLRRKTTPEHSRLKSPAPNSTSYRTPPLPTSKSSSYAIATSSSTEPSSLATKKYSKEKTSLSASCGDLPLRIDASLTLDFDKHLLTETHLHGKDLMGKSDYPNLSSNIRPSGLRMPSPKIGFFETSTGSNTKRMAPRRLNRTGNVENGSDLKGENTFSHKMNSKDMLSFSFSAGDQGVLARKSDGGKVFRRLKTQSVKEAKVQDPQTQSNEHAFDDGHKEKAWSFEDQIEGLRRGISAMEHCIDRD